VPATFRLIPGALLAFALSGAASGQERPWRREAAREEARRVLRVAQDAIRATERGNARAALRLCRDESYALRLLGVARLGTLGLGEEALRDLEPIGEPGAEPPAPDWPPLARARGFVEALEVAPFGSPEVTPGKALHTVATLVGQRIVAGPEEPAAKREMLTGLLAYAPVVEGGDRAGLALLLLALADEAALLDELGAPSAERAVGDGGDAVLAWLGSNAPYLYWSPRETRFRLDRRARAERVPTDAYRERHPWPPGEGPR